MPASAFLCTLYRCILRARGDFTWRSLVLCVRQQGTAAAAVRACVAMLIRFPESRWFFLYERHSTVRNFNLLRFCQMSETPFTDVRVFRKPGRVGSQRRRRLSGFFLPLPHERQPAGVAAQRHHAVSQNGDHAQTQRLIGSAMKHCLHRQRSNR